MHFTIPHAQIEITIIKYNDIYQYDKTERKEYQNKTLRGIVFKHQHY